MSDRVQFSGIYRVTRDTGHRAWCRNVLARYARACGHQLSPALIRIEIFGRPGELPPHLHGLPFDAPFERLVYATASVPRIPLRYPVCGDWSCDDDEYDWESADPVLEPAVYAGVAEEMRIIDRVTDSGRILTDAWTEALFRRRDHQAAGRPLWSIDIRPKG